MAATGGKMISRAWVADAKRRMHMRTIFLGYALVLEPDGLEVVGYQH